MIDFIADYWLFIIIIIGIIAIATLVFILYTRKVRTQYRIEEVETNTASSEADEASSTPSLDAIVRVIQLQEQEEKELLTNPAEEFEETYVTAPILENPSIPLVSSDEAESTMATNNEAPLEKPSKPVQREEDTTPKTEKKELGKYHVIFRSEDGMWIVKREGSTRVLRVLITQKEAIAWATIKAITQDTMIVIHKRDGKIRKQRY